MLFARNRSILPGSRARPKKSLSFSSRLRACSTCRRDIDLTMCTPSAKRFLTTVLSDTEISSRVSLLYLPVQLRVGVYRAPLNQRKSCVVKIPMLIVRETLAVFTPRSHLSSSVSFRSSRKCSRSGTQHNIKKYNYNRLNIPLMRKIGCPVNSGESQRIFQRVM